MTNEELSSNRHCDVELDVDNTGKVIANILYCIFEYNIWNDSSSLGEFGYLGTTSRFLRVDVVIKSLTIVWILLNTNRDC